MSSTRNFFEIIKPLFKETVTKISPLSYGSGGITSSGEFVVSDYFYRLKKLGDFASATRISHAYHNLYLDFAISEVFGKYHYIIGMISPSK